MKELWEDSHFLYDDDKDDSFCLLKNKDKIYFFLTLIVLCFFFGYGVVSFIINIFF